MADSTRFDASERTAGSLLPLVIGLGLTLGFGALFVDAILDLRAFPSEPHPTTVAEAAAITNEPPRGSWVTLTDARPDCRYPPRRSDGGGNRYFLATDATGSRHVLVSMDGEASSPCERWDDFPRIGVLHANAPGRIVGLAWEGLDWAKWPTAQVATLSTSSGPDDSRIGLWLYPLLMLPGVLLLVVGALPLRDAVRRRRAVPAGLPRVSFRMPLSTGASALRAFSLPVGVMQVVVFGPFFFFTKLPGWMTLPLGILAAIWIFAVFGSLMEGWTRRASDLLLGPEGFAIHAGPLHRMTLPWEAPEAGAARVVRDGEGSDEAGAGTLWIADEVAAKSEDADETRSLEAVAHTLSALHLQALGAQLPRADREPPGVVHCGHCGGPAAPSESEQVRCRYCGEVVTIPPAAREQLRALDARSGARLGAERLLRRLLNQPGATATNVLVVLSLPPPFLGWPLAGIVFDEFFQTRHLFDWTHGVALIVAATTFTWGLSWLVRAFVSGRAAVRLVTTRFAAIPPTVSGAPCSCRVCCAPLPDAPIEQLVVLCAFCRCENLTGVNLVPAAAREERQVGDLTSELRARLAELRRYRWLTVASLVLLALSIVSLAPAWARMRGGG